MEVQLFRGQIRSTQQEQASTYKITSWYPEMGTAQIKADELRATSGGDFIGGEIGIVSKIAKLTDSEARELQKTGMLVFWFDKDDIDD